jgi:polysaccharide transporter, PST family
MANRKKLISNFISLTILQGLNYILPLLTVPYLMRTVGITNYGLIALGQALNMIFVTVTDYGFNLTATKQISIHRDSKKDVERIFSSVLTVKVLLMIVCFTSMIIIGFFIPPFKEDPLFFILFFGISLGTVLFPVWFFQGIEEMKYITFLNISSKVIFAVGLFIFIKGTEDMMYAPILLSAGHIVVGILSLFIIGTKYKVRYRLPSLEQIQYQFKQGWSIFLSNAAVSLFTSGNTVLLGLLGTKTHVGYFSSAEKLINAASSAVHPIAQTLFPHISKLAEESKEKAIIFIQKSLKIVLAVTVPITLVTVIFADLIVTLFYGQHYEETVLTLRLLSVLPVVIGVNNLLGVQTMVTLGYNKEFSRILIFSSIQNAIVACALIPFYGYLGTVIAVLTTEFSITVRKYLFLRKVGINVLLPQKFLRSKN